MKINWKALFAAYIAVVVGIGIIVVILIAGYYFPWTTIGVLGGPLGWLIYLSIVKSEKKDGKDQFDR